MGWLPVRKRQKGKDLVCVPKQRTLLKRMLHGTRWGTSSEEEASVGLPGAQSEPGPSLSSEGGMGSLMREFLDVQQLREDRYLRELRGLRESILQTFRPAPVTPSYTRSMRMELSTPAPRRVSTDNAPVQLTDSPPRASTQQSLPPRRTKMPVPVLQKGDDIESYLWRFERLARAWR